MQYETRTLDNCVPIPYGVPTVGISAISRHEIAATPLGTYVRILPRYIQRTIGLNQPLCRWLTGIYSAQHYGVVRVRTTY